MLDPPVELPRGKSARRQAAAALALDAIKAWRASFPWPIPERHEARGVRLE